MTEAKDHLTNEHTLDHALRDQLEVIRNEEAPERLLVLARTLQDLLRQRETRN